MRVTVRPAGPLAGRFRPPGDKSVTHRAYLFGLLAEGTTVVRGANPGEDCERSLAIAAELGAEVERAAGAVRVRGTGGDLRAPRGILDCGNSGTTLRLLAGILASQPFEATLDGDASLRGRPVGRVTSPLARLGARFEAANGGRTPPLVVRGGPLEGAAFDEPTPSAQVATAIVLAGLRARGETRVAVDALARDHSERMLPAFGARLSVETGTDGVRRVSLTGPQRLRAAVVDVPADPSAAAFFFALAAATPGAEVTAEGVSLNPTRIGFLRVLEAMGARVERTPRGDSAGEPVGDVTVRGADALRAFDVPDAWVPSFVDEVPAWAIVASLANGVSRLRGAGELRVKESDRLAALAANLGAIGVKAHEAPDGLDVEGGRVAGGKVAARGDHRIAMAFAALGARARDGIEIDDVASVATSFPGFFDLYRALGGDAERHDQGAENA